MSYQERNLAILDEVRAKLKFERGEVIGKSVKFTNGFVKTTFTAVGSFHCDTTGSELFVGLKEGEIPERRFIADLSITRVLAERYPQLLSTLPAFVGIAQDQAGTFRGVLTEDFSQGRQLSVWPVYESHPALPRYLHPLFNVENRDDTEFAKMFFEVSGALRLGDMDTALARVYLVLPTQTCGRSGTEPVDVVHPLSCVVGYRHEVSCSGPCNI